MASNLKVVSRSGQAAGRDVHVDAAAPSVEIHQIQGGANFIGNHGPVNVTIGGRQRPPVPLVHPGPEHIDQEQKCKLQGLHREWVTLHNAIKKTQLTHSSAWQRINGYAMVASYHYILQADFEKVCAYVRKQISMLRNMASAPAKDKDWRAKRIQAIKVRCKLQLKDEVAYRAYIQKNFQAASLSELSTEQLQKTYAYIMAKKAV